MDSNNAPAAYFIWLWIFFQIIPNGPGPCWISWSWTIHDISRGQSQWHAKDLHQWPYMVSEDFHATVLFRQLIFLHVMILKLISESDRPIDSNSLFIRSQFSPILSHKRQLCFPIHWQPWCVFLTKMVGSGFSAYSVNLFIEAYHRITYKED